MSEPIWEQKARRLTLLSYSLLGAALGGNDSPHEA